MKLSKEQILQIDNYIYVSGIKYYDVRMEIVDHFANILEKKLDENPNLNFKREIESIHKNFSDSGFSKLLKEKTKLVTKKFFKQSLNHFITFFKLPKIIVSVLLFFCLKYLMGFFEDINNFFLILLVISVVLSISIVIKPFWKDSRIEKFLTLDLTIHFFQIFHFFVVILQSFNSRSLESLNNKTHNYLLIISYVLLFIFYWSGMHVNQKNKKLVKEQYPNVLV